MTTEDLPIVVPVGVDTMRWPLRASLIRCAECYLELYAGGITELTELAEVVAEHVQKCRGRAS
ncbi:hypothetical protein [Nucisporomicrobium flavum]|uniref:hypothetical protein n=1 Tax=Nucisporomicrobium flavum TaxID=2785915 RepID=UPI0018F6210A|nr:hypothetical protein [Nucisporomicrobium flavum]